VEKGEVVVEEEEEDPAKMKGKQQSSTEMRACPSTTHVVRRLTL